MGEVSCAFFVIEDTMKKIHREKCCNDMFFRQTYIDELKYYFVGEMPEAVLRFFENMDFKRVRGIQKRILMVYEQDFWIWSICLSMRLRRSPGSAGGWKRKHKIGLCGSV